MEVRELKLICDENGTVKDQMVSRYACARGTAYREHGEQQMEDVQREEDAARMGNMRHSSRYKGKEGPT